MTTILTTQEPDPADQFNGSGRTLGMVFAVDAPIEIVALRFWAVASSPPASVTVGLWDDGTATWLATEGASGPFATGWNEVALAAPVELSPGTTYGVAYWKASGNVPGLAGLHSAPIANGPFTAPASAGRSRNTNTGPPASAPPIAAGTFGFFADVQSAAAATAEGTASPAVGLELMAAGSRASAGVAGYGLGVELVAAGAREAVGAAASAIGLGLAAAGARPSQAEAHFVVGVTLAGSTIVVAPTPPERTFAIPADPRTLSVPAETRTLTIPEEERRVVVPA